MKKVVIASVVFCLVFIILWPHLQQVQAVDREICAPFAVIGDYGRADQPAADVANLVRGWGTQFMITVGDNNYPYGEAATIDQNIGQYYHEFIYPYVGNYGVGAEMSRFFPALGNHDWETSGAQPYLDYFTLPDNERYYDFVWGPVHFFAIDSDMREPDGASIDSNQAQWLQAALAASNSRWQLVYMHHSPYSSGASHGSIPRMQWPYKEWGADVVLSGHDHIYERLIINGLPYFVNGLGGASIHQLGDPIEGSQVRYNGEYGAMRVTACYNSIVFQFINRFNQVIDFYTLQPAYKIWLPVINK